MAEPTVDVLAAIDAEIATCLDRRHYVKGSPRHKAALAVRAAVAELIEADKSLDAANHALATTDPQSEDAETMESMRAHRQRCIKRRAAALARAGGAA